MKNFIITILSICLIASIVLTFAIIKRNEIPDEAVVRYGKICEVENEGEGKYRYEVETEDGNLWVVCGDGTEKKNDSLLIVFYTFHSNDITEWDILDYWKISDRG